AGTYFATCTTDCGVSGKSNEVTITTGVAPTPPTVALNGDGKVCGDEKETITATGCTGTITWSTGATGSSITVGAGTYFATCTTACGISGKSNEVTITKGTAPVAPVVTPSSPAPVCGNEKVTLTATSCSGTLTWSTGATTATISVGAGVYSATCSNECGTSAKSNAVTVTTGVAPTPPTVALSGDGKVCGDEKETITATGCTGTITWSTGATGSSITVGAGKYSATCTTACGISSKSNEVEIL